MEKAIEKTEAVAENLVSKGERVLSIARDEIRKAGGETETLWKEAERQVAAGKALVQENPMTATAVGFVAGAVGGLLLALLARGSRA